MTIRREYMKNMSKALMVAIAVLVLGVVARADPDNVVHSVSIVQGDFYPASVTIHPGDTIAWTNNDEDDHVISGDGYKSDVLQHGQQFQHKFTTEGTFVITD